MRRLHQRNIPTDLLLTYKNQTHSRTSLQIFYDFQLSTLAKVRHEYFGICGQVCIAVILELCPLTTPNDSV